jgi:hypothetical protein
MILYNGLHIDLADDCDPDENRLQIVEIADESELAFEIEDSDMPDPRVDEQATIDWLERRLTDEWDALHQANDEHRRAYAREDAAMMADWMASR